MAEKLFDLPLTSYPELSEANAELKTLSEIYGLYMAHVDAIRSFSTMLWVGRCKSTLSNPR